MQLTWSASYFHKQTNNQTSSHTRKLYLSRGFSSSCSPRDRSLWQAWPCTLIIPELHKYSFPTPLLQTQTHTSSTPLHTCFKRTQPQLKDPPRTRRGAGGLKEPGPPWPLIGRLPGRCRPRFTVAKQATVKHSRMAEEGDGARNVICVKHGNKRRASDWREGPWESNRKVTGSFHDGIKNEATMRIYIKVQTLQLVGFLNTPFKTFDL